MTEQSTDSMPKTDPNHPKDSFTECLKLLEGPSDEHRFVGLLFLAKTLQSKASQKALKTDSSDFKSEFKKYGDHFGAVNARKLVFESLGGLTTFESVKSIISTALLIQ